MTLLFRSETVVPQGIHGTTLAGFQPVRHAFEQNFARRGEVGASLCVWHEGNIVVDLWGGVADRQRNIPWESDTMATVFSVTKGMVAACFLVLENKGIVDYDEPVATYWPEFAEGEKQDITVRMLLNHRSGLIALDQPLPLEALESRLDEVGALLAKQRPHWPPGTDQGYHGVTYGLYTQELCRRITGETIGTVFAREIAGPLNADVHIGLPEHLEERVATLYPATTSEKIFKVIPKLLFDLGRDGRVYRQALSGGETAQAFRHPKELGPSGIQNFNTRRIHAMELCWANAVASARGLCRVYSALANGGTIDDVELAKPSSIAPIMERQSWSKRDRVLRKPMGWSQGFVKEEHAMFSPNAESFGHPGAGGSLGWCDPKARLAIGYTMNKMDYRVRSKRARLLCRAIYDCIDRN